MILGTAVLAAALSLTLALTRAAETAIEIVLIWWRSTRLNSFVVGAGSSTLRMVKNRA
jgi:hypothetical protein